MQIAASESMAIAPISSRHRENRSRRRRISRAIAGRADRLLGEYQDGVRQGNWGAESAAFEIERLFGVNRNQTLRYFMAIEIEAETRSFYNGELNRWQRLFHGNCIATPRLP